MHLEILDNKYSGTWYWYWWYYYYMSKVITAAKSQHSIVTVSKNKYVCKVVEGIYKKIVVVVYCCNNNLIFDKCYYFLL